MNCLKFAKKLLSCPFTAGIRAYNWSHVVPPYCREYCIVLAVSCLRSAFHEQGRVGPAVEAIPTLDKVAALT